MEFSLPAWLGALAGTIVAVAIYLPAIRVVEGYWRAQNTPLSPEQRNTLQERLSVLRRVILAIDIAVLATAGYWLGKALGPAGAAHSQF